MSMQIEFKDDYNETTYYFGTVKEPELSSHGEYRFTAVVAYFSNTKKWTLTEIEWSEEPEEKCKAEKRIAEIIKEWHKGKCDNSIAIPLKDSNPDDCMITYQDPGDEND